MEQLQACTHEAREDMKTLHTPQQIKIPLAEVMEKLQEEVFEFSASIHRYWHWENYGNTCS